MKTISDRKTGVRDRQGEVEMEEVEVHELSDKPTEFWKSWKNTVNIMRLQIRHPSSPPPENKVRILDMI